MVKVKEDKKFKEKCCNCSKLINLKKDKYVRVSTCNMHNAPDDNTYFHFFCWLDYFNSRVENKSKSQIKMMQDKALELFNSPMIKGLLQQVQGSGIALNMLKTPIKVVDIKSPKVEVMEKIDNDRARKRGSKTKRARKK